MNYLSVESISKSYGDNILFTDLTFGISKGQKVALVARNGTGKSSLLNILSGKDEADTGRVVFNNDISVSYLSQETGLDLSKTILDNILEGDGEIVKVIREYELYAESGDLEKLEQLTQKMDQLGAWDYETRVRQILGKLDIHDLDQVSKTLSGGQLRRIALAKVLIEQPDFLLLDEPTNHLDLDMIEWLEGFLVSTNMTLLMVTHDRYFLELVCDEILELDDKQLYRYKGNYSYFLEKKAEREEQEAASKEKARNLMRRELQWVRSTPKARTTKSKYRQEKFKDIKKAATIRLGEDEVRLEINIERLGSKTVELHNVRKAYGDRVILSGFDYNFRRQERVGIAGKNGTGKTTLLKMITGEEHADGGKIVVGETIVFGHYSQKGLSFKEEDRILDVVRSIADVIPLKNGKKITAEQMLERFLFPRPRHREVVRKLSGGEKKRLHLLTVLMKNPNFLILDEPTNDLDIFTLAILEDYLQQFPGILLVVSHDRYLMDKLCEHILVLDGKGGVRDITGNYTVWRAIEEKEKQYERERGSESESGRSKNDNKKKRADKPKTKLSFNEKYEFEQLEKDIPELEHKKSKLEEEISSGTISDHEKLLELSEELNRVMSELDEKTDRWLELSEYV